MSQVAVDNSSFKALQAKIINALGEDILNEKLDFPRLYALVELFKLAENETQLHILLDTVADETPGLKNLILIDDAKAKTEMEQEAHIVLTKLTKTDPKRAADVAKELSKEGASWQDIMTKNPDLNELIN